MRPLVRVYLITFRRPALLPRAIQSLQRQTFTDWVCEVQNGDPADQHPRQLVEALGDPRFSVRILPERIGPVAAFNLAHTPAKEPYQSILEDDNWWQPAFLAQLVAALETHPAAGLAWTNMRYWQETYDGNWEDTGRLVWNFPHATAPRLFHWPHLLQFNDMIYSNGSMLLRSSHAARLQMPGETPRDMIEHLRERMMNFPTLFLPEPLANFALTRDTFRSKDFFGWGSAQALLGASFLKHVPMTREACQSLWAHRRGLSPRSTNPLFFSAVLARDWRFLRHATGGDWLAFARSCVRRPIVALRILRAKQQHAGTWRLLCELTAARTAEARARGFTALGPDSLLDKRSPDTIGAEFGPPSTDRAKSSAPVRLPQ